MTNYVGIRDGRLMLERLLTRITDKAGQVVLVSGGLMTGKTTLMHEFSSAAAAAGALVLTAAGSLTERPVQFGVIDQLLRSAELPKEVLQRLTDLTRAEAMDSVADDGSFLAAYAVVQVVQALCGAVLGLSLDRPLVIVVDDVHHIDSASLQLLLYMRRRIAAAPVMMVLTECERPRPEHSQFHAELTRQPHHRLRLLPMSGPAIAEALTKAAGPTAAAHLAPAYHRLTGGNPMLVNALMEDYRTAMRDGRLKDEGRPVVGAAFSQAIATCLHRWFPQLLTVAQGIAVLDKHATPQSLSRLLDIGQTSVVEIMEILALAGVLCDGRFRHEAARAVALGTLSACARASLHSRAAELLYQQNCPAVDVAAHIAESGHVTGGWPVLMLQAAAAETMTGEQSDLAIRYLKLALAATADDRERVVITEALTRAMWRNAPLAVAPYLSVLEDAAELGKLSGRQAVTLLRHGLWHGDNALVDKTVAALERAPHPGDKRVLAELDLARHVIYGEEPGGYGSTGSATTQERSDDPWVTALRTLTYMWADGPGEAAVASAEHLLHSCSLEDSTVDVVTGALLALVCGGALDRASVWCQRLMEHASRRNAVTWQALLYNIQAEIALRSGDIDKALADSVTALGLLDARCWGVLVGWPLATQALANTAKGKLDSADKTFAQMVPDAMFTSIAGLRYLHARGHYHLADNRVLAAARDFQFCGELMSERGIDVPALIPIRSDLAEAYVRLGHTQLARDLVTQQLDKVQPNDYRTQGISLRVLAAASDAGQRERLLNKAVPLLRMAGDRLELARVLAALEAYQGDDAGLYGAAPPVVAEAVPAPPSPLVAVNDLATLSEAERRVAALAARGHTNREIGRRLYITVSTVEQHLTRVYKKLGVSGRVGLSAGLEGQQESPVEMSADPFDDGAVGGGHPVVIAADAKLGAA